MQKRQILFVPNRLSPFSKKCHTSSATVERLLSCAEDASSDGGASDSLLDLVPGGGDADDWDLDSDSESDSAATSGRTAARGTAATFLREDGARPAGACVTVSERVFFRTRGGASVDVDTATAALSPELLTDFCLDLDLFRGPVIAG